MTRTVAESQVGVEALFATEPAPRHLPSVPAARKALRETRERWLSEVGRVGFLEDTAAGSPRLAAARRRASRLHDQLRQAMRELDEAYEQPRRA